MDRYGHQGNDDSEPEYDVVDNPELHKPHVLARTLTRDNKYAGRFFLLTVQPFFFVSPRVRILVAVRVLSVILQ